MIHTILLVDDHPVFRQGLRHLLAREKDLTVVGEADNGHSAVEMARHTPPDLVVMDINMPGLDGIAATRQILSGAPETKIVALSVNSGKQVVRNMIQAGASGYILKESVPEEMVEGIRTVLSGDVFLSKSISNILVSDYRTVVSKPGPEPVKPSEPILHTKLHRPPIAASIIPRAGLIQVLENGCHHPVTLIVAPAGYGKSTLASQWLDVSKLSGSWISLDGGDNDLRIFLGYVIEAVKKVFPDHELGIKSLMGAANLPAEITAARYLLNDLETLPERFILVLDDYHYIHDAAIHGFIGELLAHPSRHIHLALLTRRDPPLPVANLRGRSLLTEVTTSDLRFTVSETKAFLERFLRTAVADETATILEEKMEGWVTGLHIAALSIKDGTDQKRLATGLVETPQHLQDYLIHEVVSHIPKAFRSYLLQTAVLDRFCAPLCDAVSVPASDPNQTHVTIRGRDFIDWLTEAKMFVIALDTKNRWFRYHHVFQDILRSELKRSCSPGEINDLHIRASEWFASQGLVTESIEHALAAGDHVAAAGIVEQCRHRMHEASQWQVVERWLSRLPDGVKRENAALVIAEAWIAFVRFQLERIPLMIEQAEALLGDGSSKPALLGEINFFRGNLLYWQGDAEPSVRCLEEALTQIPEDETHVRNNIELMLGLARHMTGQKSLALRSLDERIRELDLSEGYALAYLLSGLTFIHLLSGELPQAMARVRQLQTVTHKTGNENTDAWGSYLRACVHLQAWELDRACHHFAAAARHRYTLDTRAVIDAMAGLALARQLNNPHEAATETLESLQDFARELNAPQYLIMAQSCTARLSLLRGDTAPAIEWARSIEEPPTPAGLFMWVDIVPMTQARVLIAQGTEDSLEKATGMLEALRQVAKNCRFECQTIEIAVLQSMALDKLGCKEAALRTLEEVVTLAGPIGWIRPFAEAGRPVADLLKQLEKQNICVEHIGKILPAFNHDAQTVDLESMEALTDQRPSPDLPSQDPAVSPSDPPQPLVEPLTHRERDVLELLAKRLQNKEIAEKLFITPETVKGHLRNIYQKLDAGDRRQAVEKAKRLGIV